AEEQDPLGCQQALPRDRLGQDPSREGGQAPQPREEVLEGHPSPDGNRA
ncbi:MAG: LSU ribosomal protein L35p, partial [uncultured Nocardioides sp.]